MRPSTNYVATTMQGLLAVLVVVGIALTTAIAHPHVHRDELATAAMQGHANCGHSDPTISRMLKEQDAHIVPQRYEEHTHGRSLSTFVSVRNSTDTTPIRIKVCRMRAAEVAAQVQCTCRYTLSNCSPCGQSSMVEGESMTASRDLSVPAHAPTLVR